ncbi:MAG: copper amine oxidase N-terminal domain-containing protein [Bacillota bacterium]
MKGDKVVQLTIGSNVMVINGISIAMDVAAEISNGCTMLPFRWVAQALGSRVTWDEATQTVTMEL